jgi:trimeric autotransporter adhesin
MKLFYTTIFFAGFFYSSYGQQLLRDVHNTNASTLEVANAVNINGAVYFTASDVNQSLLYRTDGTPNGTVQLNMTDAGDEIQSPTNLTNLNGSLICLAHKRGSGYCLFTSTGSIAGTTELLCTDSPNSFMNVLGVMSNVLYFSFLQESSGIELWRTDGTPSGTYMVKNINPGSAGSQPASFKVIGSKAYFQADDGVNGAELWRTDGTEAGTVLVKDIYAGAPGSYPDNLTVVDTDLYFQANNGTNGRELWKANSGGAALVKDIYPGAIGSTPGSMQVLNNQLYFTAYDTVSTRLWKSDGTAAGTQLVKDVLYNVSNLTVFNNQLVFVASEGVKGFELWKSNGADDGTVLLKDINLNSVAYDDLTFGGNPAFTVAGSTLFFFANDGISGRELWKTNGTAGGTALVKNLDNAPTSSYFETATVFAVGSKIAFMMASSPGDAYEMWLSDGTSLGTVLIKNVNPGLGIELARTVPVALGTGVFLTAYSTALGYELYRTDGTSANTQLIKDLNTETVNSSATPFGRIVHFNNSTFFTANDGKSGHELWKADSTGANTVLYRDFTKNLGESVGLSAGTTGFSTFFNNFTIHNNELYWMVNGRELWKTNGTNPPQKVFDTFSATSRKVLFATLNNQLYFLTDGLYKSTAAGFEKVTHKIAGTPARSYSDADSSVKMIPYKGFLYFTARGFDNKGDELWRTDGTDSGTGLVKDINPGASGSSPYGFVMYGNKLYFTAYTDSLGYELWQSDGTAAGTVLVKDIYAGTNGGFMDNPYFEESYGALVIYNNKLYFRAANAANGTELWQSDGTAAGTVLVKDITVGAGSSTPFSLVTFKNKLYFTANNQLWKSDGTGAGTQPLKSTLFSEYRIVKGDTALYLNAYETSPAPTANCKSYELYRSDGTNSGTLRLTDIDPESKSSLPQLISAYKGRIWFSAYRADIGREFWTMRPDCLADYRFTDPGETAVSGSVNRLRFSNRIEAVNTMQANSNVVYQAGKSVEFKPGFEVKAGAVFKAQIAGCDQ